MSASGSELFDRLDDRAQRHPMNTFITGHPSVDLSTSAAAYISDLRSRFPDIPVCILDATGALTPRVRSLGITDRVGTATPTFAVDVVDEFASQVSPRSAGRFNRFIPIESTEYGHLIASDILWAHFATGTSLQKLPTALSSPSIARALIDDALAAAPPEQLWWEDSHSEKDFKRLARMFTPFTRFVLRHVSAPTLRAHQLFDNGGCVVLDFSSVPHEWRGYAMLALDSISRTYVDHLRARLNGPRGYDFYETGPLMVTVIFDPLGEYVSPFYDAYYHDHSRGQANVFVSSCSRSSPTAPETMRGLLTACSHNIFRAT